MNTNRTLKGLHWFVVSLLQSRAIYANTAFYNYSNLLVIKMILILGICKYNKIMVINVMKMQYETTI